MLVQNKDGLTYSETFLSMELQICPTCGAPFGMPSRLIEKRREIGGNFYCPNGHSLAFIKSDADRLKEELARQKESARKTEETLRETISGDHSEASPAAPTRLKQIRVNFVPN